MKKLEQKICMLVLGVVLAGCNAPNRNDRYEEQAEALSESERQVYSSAAVENGDTTRRFIRTAELRFKVEDVVRTSYDIEAITARQGGFVTYTHLATTINSSNSTPISRDSLKETIYYTIANTITLRVPNTKLDTTLKEIARNIEFLDYRTIKAEDVALQVLSNKLAQDRALKNENRLNEAIDTKAKRLRETTQAETQTAYRREQADEAMVANLSLSDQVNFSTIKLYIYQRPILKTEMHPKLNPVKPYEPNLGYKILDSLREGWEILEALFLFFLRFWVLFLGAFLGYYFYKKIRLKK
jgi:hypothetical protein